MVPNISSLAANYHILFFTASQVSKVSSCALTPWHQDSDCFHESPKISIRLRRSKVKGRSLDGADDQDLGFDSKTEQRSALCRSRRELSNAYFLAKFGFDTAENEPCQVCPIETLHRARPCQHRPAGSEGLTPSSLSSSIRVRLRRI